MVQPINLAYDIQRSQDFKELILTNYIEYSNGLSMVEYAKKEKQLLFMGSYGDTIPISV